MKAAPTEITPAARAHRDTIALVEATVTSIDAYPGQQYVIRLRAPRIAARAQPGHFVHLSCGPGLAMRRPMSIMRVSGDTLDILFKVHGVGTELLAAREPGATLSVMGPIGQPFKLEGYRPRPLLIGGGVGIPPMVYLAEHMRKLDIAPLVLMGSEVPFPFTVRPSRRLVPDLPEGVIGCMPLLDDWGIASRLASRSGFAGCFDGLVTELAEHWLRARDLTAVEVFACGPTPMLRAVAELTARYDVPCQLSLEEYMACAVGGCAGCVVEIRTPDGPAMKRVCVDGPVFEAAEVVFPPG